MARVKSILTEARQIERAVTLIHLGARLQVLESETDLSYERLLRLYKEVAGKSPIAQQLVMTQGILGPRLVAAGAVTQAELDTALRCYADPGFEFLQGLQFAVWGRRAA